MLYIDVTKADVGYDRHSTFKCGVRLDINARSRLEPGLGKLMIYSMLFNTFLTPYYLQYKSVFMNYFRYLLEYNRP